MKDWIKNSLSEEQQRPFDRSSKYSSILAAAGSGKTRTLVHLLADDLESGIEASEIVAFTFTEKAASELLARIHAISKKHMPEVNLNGIFIGTIHSWCFNYLSEQSDFYNFEPIDELHIDSLVSRFYDYLDLEKVYNLRFPKAIKKFIADIEIFYNEDLSLELVPIKIRDCISKFCKLLKNNRLITFGGMIQLSIQNLRSKGPIRVLKRLYVDEYQDVNPAQVNLIKSMISDKCHLSVVGDDLQCIYNWRGSDVKRIINFSSDFDDTSTFRLSENYRSRPNVVNLSNKIAENISLRDKEKVMEPKRSNVPFNQVNWFSVSTDEEQVSLTVDIIEKYVSGGVSYNKIAILLRSVASWGQPYVNELNRRNIPVNCPTLSRGGGFINTFLLPVLDWLLSEQNDPKNSEEERKLEKKANDLWIAAQLWGSPPEKETEFWDNLNKWWDLVDQNRTIAYDIRGSLYDFLNIVGICTSSDNNDLVVGLGIASQILRSVEEIHRRRIAGHDRRRSKGIIREVFYALIRNQKTFGESVPIDFTTNAVIVSTVHQAKGLEWPIVILPNLVQGRFPVRPSSHGTRFPNKIAARYGTTLEDEFRLFYVAFTRSKERLFLIDPCINNKRRSIFLTNLAGSNLIKKTTIEKIPDLCFNIGPEDLYDDDPKPVYLGLSDLLIYMECPYQFALRRLAAIQPSIGDDLGYGKGLHEVIQRRLDGKKAWEKAELIDNVKQNVSLPYTSEDQEKVSRKAIIRRIQNLEDLGAFDAEFEPEVPIEVVFDEGIVRGIIDGIQNMGDNSVYIRDWKSSLHEKFIDRYKKQLAFYSFALEERGLKVLGADIVDAKASEEQKKIVNYSLDLSGTYIDKTVTKIRSALKSISETNFKSTPSKGNCACCDMQRICNEKVK